MKIYKVYSLIMDAYAASGWIMNITKKENVGKSWTRKGDAQKRANQMNSATHQRHPEINDWQVIAYELVRIK